MNNSRYFLSLGLLLLSPGDAMWGQDVIQYESRIAHLAATDRYRSRSSGNWNSPSTWEISTDNGQTWRASTSTTPATGSAVSTTVLLGHTVAVTQSVAIDSAVFDGQVTISSGQTLTIANAPGADLTVTGTILNQGTFSVNTGGTWSLKSGGTFIHNSSSGISTALNAATISASSTFEYRDSGTPSLGGRTYGDLKLTTASSKSYTNSASSGSLTVGGRLEIGKGVTWNTGGFEIDIIVQGSTIVDGIWTGSGSANQGAHTFNGMFTVSSSGIYSLATTGAIQGNLNFNADVMVYGSLTAPANRQVNFNGVSPQTIGGDSTISFGNGLAAAQNLTIGAGATVQIGSGKVMKVLKDLTVLGSVTGPGSLSFEGASQTLKNNGSIPASTVLVSSAPAITGTGVWSYLTISSASTATIEGEHTLIGAGTPFAVNGTATLKSNSTIIYRGSSSQTIAPLSYRNIEINDSAGTTLFASASVSGVLTLRKGFFRAGTYLTLAPSASIVRETGSLTGTPQFGTSLSVTYVGSLALVTGPEIPSDTLVLQNLTINNHGGVTLGSEVAVNGTVDVTGGNLYTGSNTLSLGSSAAINEADPWSVIGRIRVTRRLTIGGREAFGGLGVEVNGCGSAPGPTTVVRTTGLASTLAGATSVTRYFDIVPTMNNGLAATLVFHYGANDLHGIEAANLKMYRSTDAGVSWARVGGVVDMSNKTVTVDRVNSFSRWTAGEPYPVPTLTSVNPSFGELGSSLTIELRGTGFVPGVSEVSFSGTGVTLVTFVVSSSTRIMATIAISPVATPGYRKVSIVHAGAGTAMLPDAFAIRANLFPVPAIVSVEPTSGVRGQLLNFKLRGSGFIAGSTSVSFGDSIDVRSSAVGADTSLTVTILIAPGAALGARNIVAANPAPGGGASTLIGAFTVVNPIPTLSSLSHSSGARGQSFRMTILGSCFVTDSSKVSFGEGICVDSIVVVSSSTMSIRVTIARHVVPGIRDVTVTNTSPGGGVARLAAAFVVVNPVPALSTIIPDSGYVGQRIHIVLHGANYLESVTTVNVGDGLTLDSMSVQTVDRIHASLAISPAATAGVRDVSVVNAPPGGGIGTLKGGFRVLNLQPMISSVTPAYALSGETLALTIVGANFIQGQAKLNLGQGIAIDSLTVENPGQLRVTISISPTTTGGPRDVVVTIPAPGGGSAKLARGFTVHNPTPVLGSLSATSGQRGKSMGLLVNGSGFVAGATTISFGPGIAVSSLVVSNPKQMFANISIARDALAGLRDISASNPIPGGGTATLRDYFAVVNPFPSLASVSPNSGRIGESVSVTIEGSDFLGGVSTVSFGEGIAVDTAIVDSAGTHIKANITIGAAATPGVRNVIVTNPAPVGGKATLIGGFAVNSRVPSIVSISATSGYRGKTYNLLVNGTNFVPGATALNLGLGIVVHSITVSSAYQLFGYISIDRNAAPGSRDVTVTNSGTGGGSSVIPGCFAVRNPPPILRGISPAEGALGQTIALEVKGSDFFGGVTGLNLGSGVSVITTDIDSAGTQITATITIAPEAAAGPKNVVVVNSGPGGGTATLVGAFEVTFPGPKLTRLTPLGGVRGQTLDVSIAGSGFVANATHLSFGSGISVNSESVVTPAEMVANISIGTDAVLGPKDVIVMNSPPGGGSMRLSNAFTVANPSPWLLSVSPMSGTKGQTVDVVLIGANFLTDATSVVFGDGVVVSSMIVNNLNQATATISIASEATPGARNATVTNTPPGGGSATLVAAFIIANPPPTLSSLSPLAGYRGQSTAVTIVGQHFVDGMTSVDFGPNILIHSLKVINSTQLSASIVVETSAAVGARSVTVKNTAPGGGTALLVNAFTIYNPPPTLAGLTPAVGVRGQSLSVIVQGANLIAGTTTIDFGTNIALNALGVSSLFEATASITIPMSSAPGTRDVSVSNPPPGGGTAILSGGFSIINPAPTVVKVTPASAAPGSHLNVSVSGSQFISGVTSLSFGADVAVANLVIDSSTMLHADVSIGTSAASGPRTIVVTNAGPGGGYANLTNGFAIDSDPVTTVERSCGSVLDHYMLSEVYPNPSNASARLQFTLPEESRVILNAYNVLGNLVAALVNDRRSRGSYELHWVSDNLPSGVYVLRLVAESTESGRRYICSRKVILIK